jgi:hypothetical protein
VPNGSIAVVRHQMPTTRSSTLCLDLPIDYASGQRATRGGFNEHFRLDANGQVDASRNEALSVSSPNILRLLRIHLSRLLPLSVLLVFIT